MMTSAPNRTMASATIPALSNRHKGCFSPGLDKDLRLISTIMEARRMEISAMPLSSILNLLVESNRIGLVFFLEIGIGRFVLNWMDLHRRVARPWPNAWDRLILVHRTWPCEPDRGSIDVGLWQLSFRLLCDGRRHKDLQEHYDESNEEKRIFVWQCLLWLFAKRLRQRDSPEAATNRWISTLVLCELDDDAAPKQEL